MKLRDLLLKETTKTRTENNALAYSTTLSAILDLFGIGGAGRNLSVEILTQKISQALAEDLELGLRCVLFLGDVRGGQGERRLFKIAIDTIIATQPRVVVERFLSVVPFFTRWDYLLDYSLITHKEYGEFILNLVEKEIEQEKPSLIFKWLPSNHTHGKKSDTAVIIRKHLGLNEIKWRKLLSKKRKALKVVEKDMSANKWGDINYSGVPSKASLIYRNAFLRHDEDRYKKFLEAVKKGEKKINANVLYPHEIAYQALEENNDTLEALWKALPDYVVDKTKNVLPMVDVSPSMIRFISQNSRVRAYDVSVGMGLYLAERLEGEFKDTMLTFSSEPELVRITGDSLYQKLLNTTNIRWGGSTNFTKAFNVILKTALDNNLKQEDLPQTVVVFSDMEFDEANYTDKTPFEEIKNSYNSNGYKLPQLIFWNLNGRNVQFPVRKDEKGTILVSGYSPITLQYVLTGELKTPEELMVEVLMQERYNIFK